MLHSIFISINLLFAAPADSVPQQPSMADSLREDIVVRAVNANILTPVTQTNLDKAYIKEKYFGYDIPFMLQATPSVVTRSDAGNFVGYTDMRMRGITDARISFNINGVPVNDPQNQGFYTNNFADLASSAQSIQVQRGIGTTSNGMAPIAGSINLITNDVKSPAAFNFSSGYGSFNTSRLVAEYNTGLLNNKFGFYGRVSNIESNGYRRNSGANLRTFFVSGGWFGKRSFLKFNAFGGITQTQLAYYALDKATLQSDRRTNFMQPFEKDEFRQNFFQLQYSYNITDKLNFSTSAYYVRGNTPFYQLYWPAFPFYYANMPDAVVGDSTIYAADMLPNYRVVQDFVGAMAFLNYTTERFTLNYGVHANAFRSNHSMEVNWTSLAPAGVLPYHQAYFNTGYKNEASTFVKASYFITNKFMLFGDLQLRATTWQYKAQDKAIFRDTFNVENMQWLFFNPKAGARYTLNKAMSLYASAGMVSREPTRNDYLLDERAGFNVSQNMVKPESVTDIELGANINTEKLQLATNVYFMEFRNEIMQTGELNPIGYSIRKNVSGGSFRRGIELSLNYKITKQISLFSNSAFSHNQIRAFNQTYKVYDENDVQLTEADGFTPITKTITYNNVSPLLTPQAILNNGIRFEPMSWLNFDLTARYVSKAYLNNTGDENASIPEYWLADVRAAVKLGKWFKTCEPTLSLNINNFTNTKYTPAGTSTSKIVRNSTTGEESVVATPLYFPAATANYFLTLNVKF